MRHHDVAATAVLADGHGLSGGLLRCLFIGQCLVLALHLAYLPAWFAGLALGVGGYRAVQRRRHLPRAGLLLRLAAVGGLVLGLWMQYGSLGSMEGLIGLLLGVYLLKLLETHDRRDARVMVMIGLIAVAVAFLHDQGLPMAAGALVALAWLVQSLVWLAGATTPRQAWGETAWLLGLSAPLMVLLFLGLPRLGPLWAMPQLDRAATGLTDTIAPGDIAELSRSDARAFRARFMGPEPSPAERYWRVYTLAHFDGVRWSRVTPQELAATLGEPMARFARSGRRWPWAGEGPPRFEAELLLEPDSRPWRPSLGTPLAVDEPQRFLSDGTLAGVAPLEGRALLGLASSGAPPVYPGAVALAWHTLLPRDGNLRTRALVRRLWQESGGEAGAYLRAVMARFGQAPYRYTLSPPRLTGPDRVDAFLFDSRAGYCSHYASATAVMARMAGIPARVVAGFLGGERHPDGHFTVRDYDAHAWVEVWQNDAWRRLDPTAAIAPERIEQGVRAVAGGTTFLADAPFSPLRLRHIGWANQLRLSWERLEYRWQRGVVGYRDEAREALVAEMMRRLRDLLDVLAARLPGQGVLPPLIGLLGASLLAVGGVALVRRGRRHLRARGDERLLIRGLQAWLERRGLGGQPGESPASHLRRIAPQAGRAGRALEACARDLERLAYAPVTEEECRERRRCLRRSVGEVRRLLPRRPVVR